MPRDNKIRLICTRGRHNEGVAKETVLNKPLHQTPTSVILSPEEGIHGDRWRPDQSPLDQLTLMDWRVVKTLIDDEALAHMSGDNLLCDFELSINELNPGEELMLGEEVIVKVNDSPHKACDRFAARFGNDAARWVNAKSNELHRLRGIKASVIRGGRIEIGARIQKL